MSVRRLSAVGLANGCGNAKDVCSDWDTDAVKPEIFLTGLEGDPRVGDDVGGAQKVYIMGWRVEAAPFGHGAPVQ